MDIKANINYDVHVRMSEEQRRQFTQEIQNIFIRYVKENRMEEIQHLTEFKNLLTLEANNARQQDGL